ncbi:MAG: hypothetical protein HUJ51_06275 [Eggerthellaceae bacterium]|nr:hypothetical protein [Eggerthellaceae bacterium]
MGTATLQYCESGANIDFGKVRAVSSASYDIFSMILSRIVAETNPRAIFYYILVIALIQLILAPAIKPLIFQAQNTTSKHRKSSLVNFVRRYPPLFLLMVDALLLFFYAHTIIEIYCINIIELKVTNLAWEN